MLRLLDNNKFTGTLPVSLGSKVRELHLKNNTFTGAIPSSWVNSTTLQEVYLNGNYMDGCMPNFRADDVTPEAGYCFPQAPETHSPTLAPTMVPNLTPTTPRIVTQNNTLRLHIAWSVVTLFFCVLLVAVARKYSKDKVSLLNKLKELRMVQAGQNTQSRPSQQHCEVDDAAAVDDSAEDRIENFLSE